MITFQTAVSGEENSIDSLRGAGIPAVVDVGETGDCWISVDRPMRCVVFVSKQTGRRVATCKVGSDEARVMLTPRQFGASVDALNLKVT